MPIFGNPFDGNVDKKISKEELMQAVRIDIASELEAILLYEAHAMATTDMFARKVLLDIAKEEKAHVGELLTLLRHLDPEMEEQLLQGETEVRQMYEDIFNK